MAILTRYAELMLRVDDIKIVPDLAQAIATKMGKTVASRGSNVVLMLEEPVDETTLTTYCCVFVQTFADELVRVAVTQISEALKATDEGKHRHPAEHDKAADRIVKDINATP